MAEAAEILGSRKQRGYQPVPGAPRLSLLSPCATPVSNSAGIRGFTDRWPAAPVARPRASNGAGAAALIRIPTIAEFEADLELDDDVMGAGRRRRRRWP